MNFIDGFEFNKKHIGCTFVKLIKRINEFDELYKAGLDNERSIIYPYHSFLQSHAYYQDFFLLSDWKKHIHAHADMYYDPYVSIVTVPDDATVFVDGISLKFMSDKLYTTNRMSIYEFTTMHNNCVVGGYEYIYFSVQLEFIMCIKQILCIYGPKDSCCICIESNANANQNTNVNTNINNWPISSTYPSIDTFFKKPNPFFL